MKVKDFEDPDSLDDREVQPEQYEDDEGYDDGEKREEERNKEIDGDLEFLDNKVNEVIRKRREDKEKANAVGETALTEHVDERLGEDFEDTPWVPPSVEVAW
eukprot:CAMPEP_0174823380 /NCGR_PEP_ID=MMETSP1107-20130205/23927_1 /TAXON_ID=36770 /ORGANISM="Paraphysomonas vestita, Strain GFlagA" /LENGTH=101 /DNA_ID=CAMNT_0016045659 /DNA_START=93 /DNA_END=395 /DNA_ORIENTATION=+